MGLGLGGPRWRARVRRLVAEEEVASHGKGNLLVFFSFSFFFGGGLVGRSAAQMSLLRFGAAAKLVRTDLYTLLFGQVFYYSLLDVGMSGHYALLPCSKNKFIFYPFHVYLI